MEVVRTYLLLFTIIALLAGCVPEQTSRRSTSMAPVHRLDEEKLAREKDHIRTLMEAVEARNREIEKTPEWISWASQGLGMKKLNDVIPSQYREYRKYVDSGSVYIFVHPGYYLFFHAKKPLVFRDPGDPSGSVVDAFLAASYNDPVTRLAQGQQRNEKKFIEYLTTGQKLVILVLPRDYRSSPNYLYAEGPDEYARYLNEIANGSPSILYMESETASSGKLRSDDLIPLLSFLEVTESTSVLIGGGYVGRCQKEFYHYVTNFAVTGTYSIVPEISTFSPEDISEKMAAQFLDDLNVNLQSGAEFVLMKTPGNVNVQHLPPYFSNAVLQPRSGGSRDVPEPLSCPSPNPLPPAPGGARAPAQHAQDNCN